MRRLVRIHATMSNEARDVLLRDGVLRGDPSRICEETYRPAYEWLRDRMLERIGPPDEGAAWPVWAWRRRRGRSKPRISEYRLPEGGWIVSMDVPADRVVPTDFSRWEDVLNGWLVSDDRTPGGEAVGEALMDRMEALGVDMTSRPYPEPWRSIVEASWPRVLDVEGVPDVQVTLWSFDRSTIVAETRIPPRT